MPARPPASSPSIGLAALKSRQQVAWSTGNYAIIGTTLQIVGERLCEALDLRAGSRVLDVAAGNGNATLAAARRWCEVTSTDYVASLLASGRARAQAEGHIVLFQEADAEHLPFPDASFDVVLSTFGVMFTPDQERASRELARVCKAGGNIGLATSRDFVFRYRSAAHWIEVFRTYYGPIVRTFGSLDTNRQKDLTQDLFELLAKHNRSNDSTMVVPSEYLEVVVTRK